jgi:two-component system osmolarity sensor histidine kinase EnvZ
LQAARSDTTGAGLGLAIVERAARLHGGELVLAQSGQGGLRAELVLPESSRTPYTPLVSRVRET